MFMVGERWDSGEYSLAGSHRGGEVDGYSCGLTIKETLKLCTSLEHWKGEGGEDIMGGRGVHTWWSSESIIQDGKPGGGPEVEDGPSILSLRALAETPGPGLRARS